MHLPARAGTIIGMESPITQPESPLEIVRRLENLVRLGTVAEVRHATPARCRVQTGALLTDWLPWITARAGGDRTWWAPEVGEQVIILSPGGNTGAGVVLPAAYSDTNEQPGQRDDVARVVFKDGVSIEYDRALHVLRVSSPQLITLRVSSQVRIEGDLYVNGRLHVTRDIRSDGQIMGARGVWPPRPLMVPRIQRNSADEGIHP